MRLSRAFLLLASAPVLVLAQDAVVSLGIVHGFDYSDPYASPLQVFKERRNHVVAVASILQFYGNLTHYVPQAQKYMTKSKSFRAFEDGLISSPLWHRYATYSKWPVLKEGGLDDLRHAVEGALHHNVDRRLIAQHLVELVPRTIEYPDRLKKWALSTLAIKKNLYPDDTITIGFAKLVLELEVEDDVSGSGSKSYKVLVPKQITELDAYDFEADRKAIVDNAERLAEQIHPVSIDRFKEYFTSTLNDDGDDGEHAPTKSAVHGSDFNYDEQFIITRRARNHPLSFWL